MVQYRSNPFLAETVIEFRCYWISFGNSISITKLEYTLRRFRFCRPRFPISIFGILEFYGLRKLHSHMEETTFDQASNHKILWQVRQVGSTSVSWFDNIMINHEMSLKVTMFFETFFMFVQGLFSIRNTGTELGMSWHIMNWHDMSPTSSERLRLTAMERECILLTAFLVCTILVNISFPQLFFIKWCICRKADIWIRKCLMNEISQHVDARFRRCTLQ